MSRKSTTRLEESDKRLDGLFLGPVLYVNTVISAVIVVLLLGYHVKIKAGYFEVIAGKAKGVSSCGLVLNHTC